MDFVPTPPQKPGSSQQPVEDLFGDTLPDTAPPQPTFEQRAAAMQQATAQQRITANVDANTNTYADADLDTGVGRLPRNRLFLLIGVAAFAVVVLAVVYGPALWQRMFGGAQQTISNINQVRPITNTTIPSRTNQQIRGQTVDADGDGLTDAEEQSLGTSPTVVDTDRDGLTDRQEVQVYQTNPNNADTDGDSFTDGDEVRHFYNPNGSGKLLNVNEAINTLSNTNQ